MRNIPFLTLVLNSKYLQFDCPDLCPDSFHVEMILPNLLTAQNSFDRLHVDFFLCIEDLLFELHEGKHSLHFAVHRLIRVLTNESCYMTHILGCIRGVII